MLLPLHQYPDYYATTDGEIISYRRFGKKKILKQSVSMGYFVVSMFGPLDERGKSIVTRRYVHQLVLEAHGFFRTKEKNQVRHKDNNKMNNSLDNIEWTDQTTNQSDRITNSTDVATIRKNKYWSSYRNYK